MLPPIWHSPKAQVALPTMTNDTHRDLWCCIKDDPNVFEVTALVDANIGQLKKLVWEQRKNGALQEIDAADLVLLKVSNKCLAGCSQLTSYS